MGASRRSVAAPATFGLPILSDWLLVADCAVSATSLALLMRSLFDDWSGLLVFLSSPPVTADVAEVLMLLIGYLFTSHAGGIIS
ncbi:hypothetical protein HanPI659440_Chr10g0386021 [Helianthus annuus]|nr:hypothetical protein HanPI659440_Chr10g0386021 [Helianthus annuus]